MSCVMGLSIRDGLLTTTARPGCIYISTLYLSTVVSPWASGTRPLLTSAAHEASNDAASRANRQDFKGLKHAEVQLSMRQQRSRAYPVSQSKGEYRLKTCEKIQDDYRPRAGVV